MRQLREPNGTPLTDESYRVCKLGLHPLRVPIFATVKVTMYEHNALLPPTVMYVCQECADKRLRSYLEVCNYLEIEVVGRVKK